MRRREGAENAVSVTLPYSGESFSVPANVDIIGTMNTADRSLALLDTALRRRFEFVPVMPDARNDPGAPLAGLRLSLGEHVIDVPRMLDAINQRVEALYDRDHCVGHAYVTPLAKVPDRSGSACLNSIPRLLSGRLCADCQRCRVVHGGGRRLRRTDRRGVQLGAHQGCHLMRPASLASARRSTLRPA